MLAPLLQGLAAGQVAHCSAHCRVQEEADPAPCTCSTCSTAHHAAQLHALQWLLITGVRCHDVTTDVTCHGVTGCASHRDVSISEARSVTVTMSHNHRWLLAPLARDTAQLSLSKWHNTTEHIVTRHANTPHILLHLVRDMSQDWQPCACACSASSIIMIVISSVLETQPGVAEISIIPPKLIKASIKEFGFCIQSHSIQLFNYMLSVPSVDKIKTMVIFIVRG